MLRKFNFKTASSEKLKTKADATGMIDEISISFEIFFGNYCNKH